MPRSRNINLALTEASRGIALFVVVRVMLYLVDFEVPTCVHHSEACKYGITRFSGIAMHRDTGEKDGRRLPYLFGVVSTKNRRIRRAAKRHKRRLSRSLLGYFHASSSCDVFNL